jgi:signal peptidase II
MTDKKNRPWLYLIIAAAFVVLDQISKWLVVELLKPVGSVTLIPNFLRLTYLENRGAAFGSFSEHRWVFMIFSTVAIVGVIVYLLRFAENNRLLRWTLALIIGGGVGNMIDRVALGYVVDFIDFCGIWSYIFNVADSCVCIGAGMLVLYCILGMRDEMKEQKTKSAEPPTDGNGGAA